MKHNIISKYIVMILLGSLFICLFASCGSKDEGVNGIPAGNQAQHSEINIESPQPTLEVSKEPQPTLETSKEPPQPTLEATKEPPQPTPEVTQEPPRSTPEATKEPLQPTPEPPQPTPEVTREPTQPTPETNGEELDENISLSAEESYKAILLGNKDFIASSEDGKFNGRDDKMVNIKNIKEVIGDVPARVAEFAIIDIDGDGENEVVLFNQIGSYQQYWDEGFVVLHYQEGKVYGYHFVLRGLIGLKTDGTFESSGGVFLNSIHKLEFLEKGYIQHTLYYEWYHSDGSVELYANGEPCTQEEIEEAFRLQREKTGVEWYELTPDNVNLAFENRF